MNEAKKRRVSDHSIISHHLFQVWAELVELVDSADVNPAGVLVHHQVVELRTFLVGQAALVRELGDYVQAATWATGFY